MHHFQDRLVPLFLLSLPLFFIACSKEPEDRSAAAPSASAPASCVLTMGWDPWEPYQYRNARGEITGLDIDIAKAVATAAGCELRFVDGQWMEMLNNLRDGDVDLLAGATATPGREKFAVFTAPYRSESFVVFTLADNAAVREAATLDALFGSDARIGTVAEYYYGEEVLALLDAAAADGRLNEVPVAELNYRMLLNGEIDAFLEDPFVASSIVRSRGWGERIIATGLNATTGDVSFMLSRQSVTPENVERFSSALQRMRDNGELAAIVSAYRR